MEETTLVHRDDSEIVALLVSDFLAKSEAELTKKAGKITQDSIDQGLFNTTTRARQLLQVHYELISQLADFLIVTIEKDYEQVSPSKCKEELLKVVGREFDKLAHKVPKWLSESSQLDDEMLTDFKQGVISEKDKVRESLENSCDLWEKRWKEKKKQKSIEFIKWLVGSGFVVMIIMLLLRACLPGEKQSIEVAEPAQKELRITPIDPNTGKTALNVRTRERVEELADFIIKEKIDPWLFVWHRSFKVTKDDGTIIEHPGVEYSGSLRRTFLAEDYIDPFLAKGIKKVLDETGQECRTNNIRAEEPLKEAAALLTGMIWNIYDRMAEVDSRLRKKRGDSEKVSRVDLEDRIRAMDKKLRDHLQAALVLYSGSSG